MENKTTDYRDELRYKNLHDLSKNLVDLLMKVHPCDEPLDLEFAYKDCDYKTLIISVNEVATSYFSYWPSVDCFIFTNPISGKNIHIRKPR